MDKSIQDLLNENNRYNYNRAKAYSVLNRNATIPELFDFLFTGSPVTTAYSSFFPGSSLFDRPLSNLNKALADECNKRIKELGLDKISSISSIKATGNYNGIELNVGLTVTTKDLCFSNSVKHYYPFVSYLYTSIARHGVFTIGTDKPENLIVRDDYSCLSKNWYFKWDNDKRLPIINSNPITTIEIAYGSLFTRRYVKKMLKQYYKLPIRKISLDMVIDDIYLDNANSIYKDALSNFNKDAELYKERYNRDYIEPLTAIYTKLFKKQVVVLPLKIIPSRSKVFNSVNK